MNGDIERVREALHFIPASDRETWIRMGMAVKSEFGDTGFDTWEEWSQQDKSFDQKAARDAWKSISSTGKVTVGTLFHEAKAHGWHDDGTFQRPTHEDLAARRREAVERVATEEAKTARDHTEAAKKAAMIWKSASMAKSDHPYLLRKGVSPVTTLREIDVDIAAVILGYSPKAGGDQLIGRLLVVPVKVGDALSTLELIDGDGRKSAIAGGRKAGGYWAAQVLPEGDGDGLTFQYGEGVATTLSAKEANGHISVAALSVGNLAAVANIMHERYPAASHVILADLVKATGTPDPRAIEAAQLIGGYVALPDFGGYRPDDAKDFNDMHSLSGLEAVGRAIGTVGATARPQIQLDKDSANDGLLSGTGWPEPQPLATKVAPEPYPLDALPIPIRAAVEEVLAFVKAPLPLVVSSALAALSLAGQVHVDAKRAEKLTGPVGLFLLTIADSGEVGS